MTNEQKILHEIRSMRIDQLQAEMNRLGLFTNDRYVAMLIDKINGLDREMAEDEAEAIMESQTSGYVQLDGNDSQILQDR